MRSEPRYGLSVLGALVIACAMCGTARAGAAAVSVHVQKPNLKRSVHISFRPIGKLPPDGYYYAVMVLRPYRHYPRASPPPCSSASDMERADYGYPQSGKPVRLALTPARSTTGHWCRGGTYAGAIYAVPKRRPAKANIRAAANPMNHPVRAGKSRLGAGPAGSR